MAKTKISEFDSNPVNNTDIDGINLAEGMAPGLVNNSIRELMALLKDFQTGTAGDNFTVGGNLSVTGTTALTGAVTIAGSAIDAFPSGTKMLFQQSTAPTGWTKDTTHDNKALRVVTGSTSSGGSVNFTTAFASKAVSGTIGNTTAGGTVGGTSLTAAQLPSHNHTGSGTTGNNNVGHTHTYSSSVSGTTGNQNANHVHAVNINTNTAGAHNHTYQLRSEGDNTIGSGIAAPLNDTVTSTTSEHAGHVHNVSGNTGGNSANHGHSFSASFSGTTAGISANHNHTYSFTTSSVGSGSSHTHSFTGSEHNHTFSGTAIDLAVQYVDVIICTKS
jgi:hypothetical protein